MSEKQERIKEQFLNDTKDHVMTVILDQGLNRHLLFENPKSSEYWFEIITWHNSICINGDVGCFVFSKYPDMLEFFNNNDIDPRYWAQKIVSGDAKALSYLWCYSAIEWAIKQYDEFKSEAAHV